MATQWMYCWSMERRIIGSEKWSDSRAESGNQRTIVKLVVIHRNTHTTDSIAALHTAGSYVSCLVTYARARINVVT